VSHGVGRQTAATEVVMKGVVKTVYTEKGYCFIRGEDSKEYFAHRTACRNFKWEELGAGQAVTFEPEEGEKGLRAEELYV